jgi:hypothetical protein
MLIILLTVYGIFPASAKDKLDISIKEVIERTRKCDVPYDIPTTQELEMVFAVRKSYEKNPPCSQLRNKQQKHCDIHYFNYGATGRAADISVTALLKVSDNPEDRKMIKYGINYYDMQYGKVTVCKPQA